jgi:hypothetical protein
MIKFSLLKGKKDEIGQIAIQHTVFSGSSKRIPGGEA